MATSNQDLPDPKKFALLIGNGNYHRSDNKLNNSINNVRELENLLKTINFNVTTLRDVDKHHMNTGIIDFSEKISDGDMVLIYYSGHAFQVDKKNYLIPTDDARIESDTDVEDYAINIGLTLARFIKINPSYVTILILDCCKPYLLKGASGASSNVGKNGLYEMKAPKGAFIQFACAANQVANDNLFTKHLLNNIAEENVELNDIFKDIQNKVYQESNQRQKPLSINGLQHHQEVYLKKSELSTAKFLTQKPLTHEEKDYYEDCKEYYRLTKEPLIAVADEVLDNDTEITSSSIKFGIDEDCNNFDLLGFLNIICSNLPLKMNDIAVKQIQEGSTIMEADLFNKDEPSKKKVKLKMIFQHFKSGFKEMLGKLKAFFLFMGPIDSLPKIQKHRSEIKLNPEFNRIYGSGHHYWLGPLNDGKDRGNQPYFCPVGWQRWSLYVTDNFYQKFKGWCICYHGTKFLYGLAILLSGLKPAEADEHGAGIYATPSVNYAAHPRYSEVKLMDSPDRKKFFKSGKYIQFVLECRVRPSNIKLIAKETLGVKYTTIDPNISNDVIEWIIKNHGKSIVDFNDPDSSIICTGLLTRVTDEHPGLLPESEWWYDSHLCDPPHCLLGVDRSSLRRQKQRGDTCKIIHS